MPQLFVAVTVFAAHRAGEPGEAGELAGGFCLLAKIQTSIERKPAFIQSPSRTVFDTGLVVTVQAGMFAVDLAGQGKIRVGEQHGAIG